jgi:hypothetical protein
VLSQRVVCGIATGTRESCSALASLEFCSSTAAGNFLLLLSSWTTEKVPA